LSGEQAANDLAFLVGQAHVVHTSRGPAAVTTSRRRWACTLCSHHRCAPFSAPRGTVDEVRPGMPAFVGMPSDATPSSRIGARFGPRALRH